MALTEQLEADVKGIQEALRRLVRVGVVNSTYPERGTVRVKVADQDGMITWECPVLFEKTYRDKSYWMPDVGDHVIVVSLPYGPSQGFVLGAIYSQADAVPVSSQDKRHVTFDDGSWFEYDRSSHAFSGHIKDGYVKELTIDQDALIHVGNDAQVTVGNNLMADVTNNVSLAAGGQITLAAPLTEHTGNYTLHGTLQVNGSIYATGEIIDSGGNTNHHSH